MINRGEKVLDGPLTEVKGRFGSNTLVLSGEFPSDALRKLPGVIEVRSDRLRHELSLADGTDLQAMLPEIIKVGRLDGLERVQPSLHQIFLTMVETGASLQDQEGQSS
jgi:ABC-2 type transport system ATP-binding protein